MVWGADSRSLAYTEVNDNWRTYRARLHHLGTDPTADATLYEETADIGFNVGIGRTQDRQWLAIATGDNQTSEVRIVPTADLSAAP